MKLFTVGYQGRDISEFVDLVDDQNIDVLADVRDSPSSRKPGFSRHQLSDALRSRGIDYVHFESLGNPEKIRYADASTDEILEMYADHMADRWDEVLPELMETARRQQVCLMCYERKPSECHRTVVADEMGRREDFEIIEL